MFIVRQSRESMQNLNFPELRDEYLSAQYDQKVVQDRVITQKIKVQFEQIENCYTKIRILLVSRPNIFVTISPCDYDAIKFYTLSETSTGHIACQQDGKTDRIHRVIMNINDPMVFIDHIDGNKYNNTRENLRISNASLNSQNKKKRLGTSSKYMGVRYHKIERNWQAQITVNCVRKHLGSFSNEEDAARARDTYILKNIPNSHFKLNFEPKKVELTEQDMIEIYALLNSL